MWARLKRFWTKEQSGEVMPYSLVLLLRKPHTFSRDELQVGAERAWGRSFDGQADPMYFVVQQRGMSMVKVGGHLIQVVHAQQAYLDDPKAIAKQLPRDEQKKAWLEHHAWTAFDFWNIKLSKTDAYETLAKLVLQLADANCSGVLLPRDEVLLPNDGTAEEGLHLLARRQQF